MWRTWTIQIVGTLDAPVRLNRDSDRPGEHEYLVHRQDGRILETPRSARWSFGWHARHCGHACGLCCSIYVRIAARSSRARGVYSTLIDRSASKARSISPSGTNSPRRACSSPSRIAARASSSSANNAGTFVGHRQKDGSERILFFRRQSPRLCDGLFEELGHGASLAHFADGKSRRSQSGAREV